MVLAANDSKKIIKNLLLPLLLHPLDFGEYCKSKESFIFPPLLLFPPPPPGCNIFDWKGYAIVKLPVMESV